MLIFFAGKLSPARRIWLLLCQHQLKKDSRCVVPGGSKYSSSKPSSVSDETVWLFSNKIYSVCSDPKCWMLCAPSFLQSTQGVSRWWFMTFVWHFKRLPQPQSMFPTSWRFLCEWSTRSDFIPHSPSLWVCVDTASLRWSLLSGPHIPEMPQWFLSRIYFLFKHSSTSFLWRALLDLHH